MRRLKTWRGRLPIFFERKYLPEGGVECSKGNQTPFLKLKDFPYATITYTDYRSQRQNKQVYDFNTLLNNHRKEY